MLRGQTTVLHESRRKSAIVFQARKKKTKTSADAWEYTRNSQTNQTAITLPRKTIAIITLRTVVMTLTESARIARRKRRCRCGGTTGDLHALSLCLGAL